MGLFPVDERFGLHTLVASGMVVVFASLIVRIRALVPSISATFAALGWVFLAVIVVAAVMWFPVGYYNLTAVELIAASLVFAWLIVLIRNLAAVDADQLDATLQTRPLARPTGPAAGPVQTAADETPAEP